MIKTYSNINYNSNNPLHKKDGLTSENATFSKQVDFTSSYKPVASIYGQFVTEADKYKFMLKFSDKLNEFKVKRSWQLSYVDAVFEQNKGIVRVVERTTEGERKISKK